MVWVCYSSSLTCIIFVAALLRLLLFAVLCHLLLWWHKTTPAAVWVTCVPKGNRIPPWNKVGRPCAPRVTFRQAAVSLRGPRQSPVVPFACCVGLLRFVSCCGVCSCWCCFCVRRAPSFGPGHKITPKRGDKTTLKTTLGGFMPTF